MKRSIYNNVISLSTGYFLLYNSYANMYILMKKNVCDAFFMLSVEEIKIKFSSFYEKLIESGCLVEDYIDEVGLLKERIHQVENEDSDYYLTINPTLNCNFKCWYCYENHLYKSKMEVDILERVKKHLENVIKKLNHTQRFHLGFFGGEPLLYYTDVVQPILKHLKLLCMEYGVDSSIGITSNGYLIKEQMVNELKELNVSSFQITLDGGREFHNKVRYPYNGGDSYNQILSSIKKLIHVGIYVVLRINYTQANLLSVRSIIEDLKDIPESDKLFLAVDFQRVWQDGDSNDLVLQDCLEECIDGFENLGLRVSSRILNQVWRPCYADRKNQALINFNGDVYKCTARDFTHENRLGVLNASGDIEWDAHKMGRRMNQRLSKEMCCDCRIAPLCGGTCTQRILDSGDRIDCIRGLDETGKDRVVLDRFYYNMVKQV
ncbi:radical SAM protein [Bacteroides fragilis]|nr:radical SAM protein [Bacteroides fragilis]CCZ38176.1 radical SAM domain protein [Bacteroides fragilis CAG:558]